MKPGTRRRARIALAVVSLLAVGASMIVAVQRAGQAREELSRTEELRSEVEEARDEVRRARRAVDSLRSRRRILEAAGRMGFRTPADSQVRFLPGLAADTARRAPGRARDGAEER